MFMCDENTISENIEESFVATDYSFSMLNYREIYARISESLPPRNRYFAALSLDDVIGCEVICAAICHQINWDFLRRVVYERTIQTATWLSPKNLAKITIAEIVQLLGSYDKPERIRGKERCSLLRSVGKILLSRGYSYTEIFFSKNMAVKSPDEILAVINSSKAFSGDPEGKKLNYCYKIFLNILNYLLSQLIANLRLIVISFGHFCVEDWYYLQVNRY